MDRIPNDIARENAFLDYGLYLLAKMLARSEQTLAEFNLPESRITWEEHIINPTIAAAMNFDPVEQQRLLDDKLPSLNQGQWAAYDTIVEAIDTFPQGANFFLQGPGGTGKMFVYKVLCYTYRARGNIVLCVASSSIAFLLLPGGITAHSQFKIPLECTAGVPVLFLSKVRLQISYAEFI